MYGSTKGVASLVPKYADNRNDEVDFTTRTTPTKLQLDAWLHQISGYLDMCLGTNGFAIPISPENEQAYKMMSMFVELEASALVEGVNGVVKVSTYGKENNVWTLSSALLSMRAEVCNWVEENAPGLILIGVENSNPTTFLFPDNDYDFIFKRNQYDRDSK